MTRQMVCTSPLLKPALFVVVLVVDELVVVVQLGHIST